MNNEENKPNQEQPENSWLHDQDLNFSRVRGGLQIVAGALQSTIDEHKKELARLINARNLVKK
jgi:hypothetical protein